MTVHTRGATGFGRHTVGPSDQGDPWQTRGACRDHNPELFFTNGRGRPSQDQQERAASVCRECPVQRECREWAIDTAQEYGVWGGMTETQLHAEIRNRREQPVNFVGELRPCGTWAAYRRHLNRHEPIDDACRQAQIEHREAEKRRAAAKAAAR